MKGACEVVKCRLLEGHVGSSWTKIKSGVEGAQSTTSMDKDSDDIMIVNVMYD